MNRFIRTFVSLAFCAACLPHCQAQSLYWDINGSSPGVGQDGGGFNDGTWDTVTANWNPVADGTGTTQTWADGNTAVFSAGTDGTDAIITNSGTKTLGGLTIEEGMVEIQGLNNSVVLGTNPARINQGATLQMPVTGFSLVSISAGQVLTMDGGKLRSKIAGVGSGIWSGLGTIELTANGGTMETPHGPATGTQPNGAYSIMAYTGTINLASGVTAATLTKTGSDELRLRNSNKFTTLDIQQGLLRIDGTGGLETSIGDPNGTVKIAGGATEHTTDGAAIGTSAGLTGASASPATRSFQLTGVGATNDSVFVTNASWTINGNISGAGGLMLNGWVRNDGGPATGSSSIGSQLSILLLGGTNTYGGKTTINYATLAATGGSAIPNTSQVVFSTRSDWGGTNNLPATTNNTAVLRVDASETIGSLAGGNATRGSVNINGAAVTLTTGADNTSSTFSGAITGAGSLAKSGSGVFTMDGVKSYTGDTSVLAGTLSTNSTSLADAADVYLATGSLFNLNFVGTDTIDSLFFSNVAQAIGTWGAPGSGATNTSSLFSGTGLLQVTTLPTVGVPGDYNGNGTVDAADYVLWRNGGPLQNEVDTPGTVNAADYTEWRARFGNTSGSGSALGTAAIPEPASLALLTICAAGLLVGRRNR